MIQHRSSAIRFLCSLIASLMIVIMASCVGSSSTNTVNNDQQQLRQQRQVVGFVRNARLMDLLKGIPAAAGVNRGLQAVGRRSDDDLLAGALKRLQLINQIYSKMGRPRYGKRSGPSDVTHQMLPMTSTADDQQQGWQGVTSSLDGGSSFIANREDDENHYTAGKLPSEAAWDPHWQQPSSPSDQLSNGNVPSTAAVLPPNESLLRFQTSASMADDSTEGHSSLPSNDDEKEVYFDGGNNEMTPIKEYNPTEELLEELFFDDQLATQPSKQRDFEIMHDGNEGQISDDPQHRNSMASMDNWPATGHRVLESNQPQWGHVLGFNQPTMSQMTNRPDRNQQQVKFQQQQVLFSNPSMVMVSSDLPAWGTIVT